MWQVIKDPPPVPKLIDVNKYKVKNDGALGEFICAITDGNVIYWLHEPGLRYGVTLDVWIALVEEDGDWYVTTAFDEFTIEHRSRKTRLLEGEWLSNVLGDACGDC